MDHAARRLQEAWLADMMARFFHGYCLANEVSEILIRAAARHHTVQIVIEMREKASADFAI
jgi:hypothetical protein